MTFSADNITTLVVTLIVALLGGGGLTAFFTARSDRMKAGADAVSTLSKTVTEMATNYNNLLEDHQELRKKVEALEKLVTDKDMTIAELNRENAALKKMASENITLRAQVNELTRRVADLEHQLHQAQGD